MKNRVILGALLVSVSGLAERAPALQPAQLPALQLTTPDGRQVEIGEIVRQGRWLLLYVRPDCRPCEAVLRFLSKDERRWLAGHLAVVVGGESAAGLAPMVRKFPGLESAVWYADGPKALADALQLSGAPLVLGLRQDVVEWRLAGTLSDSSRLESILASWVRR